MPTTLKSRFPTISAELRPKVGLAVAEGAEIVMENAWVRVPVDEGDLREAIHVERLDAAEYSVVAGNEDVFYGHIVEFGGSGANDPGPRPFLVPALEASTFEIIALVTGALRGL
jgi:hypothetical protein